MKQAIYPSLHRGLLWLLIAFTACVGIAVGDTAPLRIGLTPVFLDDQPRIIGAWREYLEEHIGREIDFVQRTSYLEITDLLLKGKLDVAWLCGLPYVERITRLSLVAVPLYMGAPLYRSYLIVPKDDTSTQSWADVPPGVFAFSDPDSNSGSLYPRWAMRKAGIDVDTYFRKVFFTRGHREVIEAVATGLADAGAVDGYVWETLKRDRPQLTAATRIVLQSETFGFPPVVARGDLPDAEIQGLRRVLVGMSDNPKGRQILQQFNLDGFVEVEPTLYDSIAEMSRFLGRMR